MSACCSPFECAADQQFNAKKATEELTRYRTKGPGPTTRLLQHGPEIQRLQTEMADAASQVASEQARWADINQRLEEMDRALTRR